MKSGSYRSLQVFLWFICAFHIGVGLGVNLSQGFARGVAAYYGAQVDWTPQFLYIIKPLGAFMIALGLLAAGAALNPLKHRLIPYGFVALFVIRALQRLAFRQEIHEAFSIAPGRLLAQAVFFLAMAAALFFLHRQVGKGEGGPGAASR